MPLPLTTRWRRARSRRIAAAVVLACLGGAGAAFVATGPAAPVRTAAQVCAPPLITCQPSPPPPTSPPPTRSATPKPPPSNPPPTRSAVPGSTAPAYVPPGGTPLPTLPPPSPGAPPQPPTLEVQTIQLALASSAPPAPGSEVLVQATLEAQRGSDTYAVPHATVSFSITSAPGSGAAVDPAQADSGDTGVVVVTVRTGDQPGDTVVHAVSGNAATDISLHAEARSTPSPTPHPTTAPVAVTSGNNSGKGSRPLLVAGLASLLAAMVGGYAAALVLGRLPNPFQRGRVWGRRSRF